MTALMGHLPALALVVLAFAAPVAFLVNPRAARLLAIAAGVVELVLALWLAQTVRLFGTVVYRIGGWGAPLGIDFRVDGISATMIALTAVVGLAVTLYAADYFKAKEAYRYYWPLWLFLWAALVALFMTSDAFNLYVCLELVSVSAVALVAVGGGRTALVAAMRYMFAAIAGSLFYLFGVALLYGAQGVLDIAMLAQMPVTSQAAKAGLALIAVGLVIKTALIPMHFWLPPAHANAPAPVSAVLSALVVKGSFYILLRLAMAMDGRSLMPGLSTLLGTLGALAIVWGSVQALRQARLKMLVAYSTVAQIGYLFILFPLVGAARDAAQASTAVSAGLLHALSHGLAKGSMFLAAGAVLATLGHDRIADLAGLARRSPAQALAFGLAGVSMLGLPPSGGFASKWLYVSAALQTGAWWWAIPVLAGGLLAAAYVFRVVAIMLRTPPESDAETNHAHAAAGAGAGEADESRTVGSMMSLAPLALAVASVLLGVAAQPVLELVEPAARGLAAGVGL